MSNVQVENGVKFLAFTRKGRSNQLKQAINDVELPTASVVDGAPIDARVYLNYSILDMMMGIFSIVCYLADMFFEVRLAVFYYTAAASTPPFEDTVSSCHHLQVPDQYSYMIWFYVTVFFIIFPGLVCGLCSLSWHITDFRMRRKEGKDTSSFRYLVRFIMPLFLLGPVLHNIEAILFAFAAKRTSNRQYKLYLYEEALFEDADAALLRIIECFLESLPQLVLQLHIVMASIPLFGQVSQCPSLQPAVNVLSLESTRDPVCGVFLSHFVHWFPSLPLEIDCQMVLQLFAITATIIGAAWALVSYQRTLRRFLFSHRQLPLFPSSVVLFLAHSFLISGRVIAIVFFVQVLGWGALCGLLFCHALVMFLWLHSGCTTSSKRRPQLPSGFCCGDSATAKIFFNLVLALMYTSAYINVFDTPSWARYIFFFSITLAENVSFILAWFFLTASSSTVTAFSTLVILLAICLSLVFGGIVLLLIYYKFFHPNVFHKSSKAGLQSNCCGSKAV